MNNNIFEIMHKDRRVARVDSSSGRCKIYYKSFMPYNLYLEEEEDVDTLVNNITNFNYWCATRVLTLDRKYAKEILNSIGMNQAVTDKDRAKVALSYRCTSLTDVFWVRNKGEKITFSEVNLYDNHLENIFIDIALRGKQYTVNNEDLAKDLSTNGVFPKAWKRTEKGFSLLKDGGIEVVEKELLSSKICQCFDVKQVIYNRSVFAEEPVTISENITSKDFSIVSMEAFEVYSQNHDRNIRKYILALDKHDYYMMNIIDYLVGNTDRHWGNWGVLVNNVNNKPVSLHPLMDFNKTFNSYETIEGSNCQTCFGKRISQKDAALEAVRKIGLNQIKEVNYDWFEYFPEYVGMFKKRYGILKRIND